MSSIYHNNRDMPQALAQALGIEIHDSDCTAFPFWLILIPREFNGRKPTIHEIGSRIVGVWLSRPAAERHLEGRRYEYGDEARVYCCSGNWSRDWRAVSNAMRRPALVEEVSVVDNGGPYPPPNVEIDIGPYLGDVLLQARERAGLCYEEVQEARESVLPDHISRIESGEIEPSLTLLRQLCALYAVPVSIVMAVAERNLALSLVGHEDAPVAQ